MTIFLWAGFILLVLCLLALDLGVFNRRPHEVGTREALGWTVFWVFLALVFNGFVYYAYAQHWLGLGAESGLGGRQAAIEYLTGYILEKSLSLDNIFVIALIFSYFQVPAAYQHRVLFWGIIGALVMRGMMIAAGAALIHRFEWMIYVFGVLLLLTALRMLFAKHESVDLDRNFLVRVVRRLCPVSGRYEGPRFFTRIDGRKAMTPLFVALLVVESSDLLFAVDSIPAIFAVTRDPFIVFTSNVFAILGLRALYFALAAVMGRFRFVKQSLVVVLAFVAVKMLLSHHLHIPTPISLAVIAVIVAAGIVTSVTLPQRAETPESPQ